MAQTNLDEASDPAVTPDAGSGGDADTTGVTEDALTDRERHLAEVRAHVAAMTAKHLAVLTALLDKVPDHAKLAIRHAIEASSHGHDIAVARLGGGGGEVIGDATAGTTGDASAGSTEDAGATEDAAAGRHGVGLAGPMPESASATGEAHAMFGKAKAMANKARAQERAKAKKQAATSKRSSKAGSTHRGGKGSGAGQGSRPSDHPARP